MASMLMRRLTNVGVYLLRCHQDERGATTLEYTLLIAVIALPAYGIIRVALAALIGQYQMLVMLNGLPFP